MKFIKENVSKGIKIPAAALNISRIPCGESVELHALDHTLILLKGRMTAPELVTVIQQFLVLSTGLFEHLTSVCGPCEDCGGAGVCPCEDLEDTDIDPTGFLRECAGISADAKLCVETDEENHTVTVSEAGYRHGLRDIPVELVRVAETLQELASDLLSALVEACDHCDNCQLDTPCKLMTGPIVPRVSIPSYMLEEAGLDPDCKLVCTAEQGRGEVRVTEAEYRFDLTDLRPDMLEMLRECDVCLSDLEEKLIQDTIVYS